MFQRALELPSLDGAFECGHLALCILDPLDGRWCWRTSFTSYVVLNDGCVLPVPEIIVVADPLGKPSQSLECRTFMDLVDLFPLSDPPLVPGLLVKGNTTDEDGFGTPAGIVRDIDF